MSAIFTLLIFILHRLIIAGLTPALLLLTIPLISINTFAERSEAVRFFSHGQTTLQQANQEYQLAREKLKQSQQLRNKIAKLRYQERQQKSKQNNNETNHRTDTLLAKHDSIQTEAQQHREKGKQLYELAEQTFASGMQALWPSHRLSERPITLTSIGEELNQAHNTTIRSAHPNMPKTASASAPKDPLYSIELAAQAGQALPPNLKLSHYIISKHQRFIAHVKIDNECNCFLLNNIHEWKLFVTTLDGKPMTNVDIHFAGHMPGHVHGLPTQPRITGMSEPGVYIVSGVKFQMSGWWVIEFHLQNENWQDRAHFNFVF